MRDPAGWAPGATIAALHRRAALLGRIREFFAVRGVVEVDTPQLCPVTVTDPPRTAALYAEPTEPTSVIDAARGAAQINRKSPSYPFYNLLCKVSLPNPPDVILSKDCRIYHL